MDAKLQNYKNTAIKCYNKFQETGKIAFYGAYVSCKEFYEARKAELEQQNGMQM